jgi:RHS repeat-associated protein
VSLTRSYDPFGNLLSSVGDEASAFGYAGQWEDGYIKLIDLRSRMYSTDGRFLTEDTWQGDQNQPMSYNDWLYVYANPVNRTDPSGYSPVGPMSYPSGFNMTGPMAFAMCFAMGVSSPNVGWTGMTAGMAVATCKAAYDKVMWRIPITPGKGLPTDTSELFDWYINEYGDDHLYFDGNQPLTTELATSLSIQNIRGMFYQNGELSLKEFQFNLPDALGSLFVDSSRFGVFPLTLTQFLGSYWYQVKALDNCRVGFRLDNDTTLSSGSHLLGRFKEGGYYGSVEDLIGRKPGIADEPLEQVLRENTTLISILTDRKRNETGGNGGGTMYQTFTWTEKRGEWRNFLPWEALRNMLDIQDWNDYAAHTKSVFH